MGKDITMYYDVGNKWQEELRSRLENLGLNIKSFDSGREETPIVQYGQIWFYGFKDISMHFFLPR